MFPRDSKVLVVDDSTFARRTVLNGLRELKFSKILEAADAKVAQTTLLQLIKEKNPIDLVILDIHMPNMSGLELLAWMRAKEDFKNTPVIILTNSQNKGEILEAAKLGVSHYIIKPFDVATLEEKLEKVWQKMSQKAAEPTQR